MTGITYTTLFVLHSLAIVISLRLNFVWTQCRFVYAFFLLSRMSRVCHNDVVRQWRDDFLIIVYLLPYRYVVTKLSRLFKVVPLSVFLCYFARVFGLSATLVSPLCPFASLFPTSFGAYALSGAIRYLIQSRYCHTASLSHTHSCMQMSTAKWVWQQSGTPADTLNSNKNDSGKCRNV